jgi:hypothetical protein
LTVICLIVIASRGKAGTETPAAGKAVVTPPANANASAPADSHSTIPQNGHVDPAPATGPDTDAPATIEEPVPSSEPQYDRAKELMAQAAQTDRQLPDRIHDYEEALTILKYIDAKSAPVQKPYDLAAQIKRVQHELELLRLKQFFP